MLAEQGPVVPGPAQRSAAAAAMPAAQASENGANAPLTPLLPSPFELPVPLAPATLEQPHINSLSAATQANVESMAKEVANVQALLDSPNASRARFCRVVS